MGELNEKALVFGREKNLLGIISEPGGGPTRPLSIVLLNAGIIHRVGASRFIVELARALAGNGYRTLRFDLSGIGDSALPRRQATLAEIVRQDIDDAIGLVSDDDGEVVLVGLCSGADNAFHIAPGDPRVRGLVLIDPMVYPTPGFRRRHMIERLTSARSWINVLFGRSIYLRLRQRVSTKSHILPPDHYGLLTDSPDEMRRKAGELETKGVHLLYIITGGAHNYCKYPEQVAESIGLAPDSPVLHIKWRPQANHLLSDRNDRDWLNQTVLQWLQPINVTGTTTGRTEGVRYSR